VPKGLPEKKKGKLPRKRRVPLSEGEKKPSRGLERLLHKKFEGTGEKRGMAGGKKKEKTVFSVP